MANTKSKVPVHLLPDAQKGVLAAKVAALFVQGYTETHIARSLNVSPHAVKKLVKHEKAVELFQEVIETTKTVSKAYANQELRDLLPEAIKTLRASLKKGNIEGVKIILKSLGVMDEKESTDSNANVTVVMPQGVPQLKTVKAEIEE